MKADFVRHDSLMTTIPLDSLTRRLAAFFLIACSLAGAMTDPVMAAASFEDTIAERAMACTACHGTLGRAAPDGYYPRLAGKPAGYLYHQLLNFRDGRRHYGLMTQLLEPLDGPVGDAYLLEIAQYFSRLEVPYPAPMPAIRNQFPSAHSSARQARGRCASSGSATTTDSISTSPGCPLTCSNREA